MIYIKEIPYSFFFPEDIIVNFNIAASGETYKTCLENLINAINANEVDAENCMLSIITDKDDQVTQ